MTSTSEISAPRRATASGFDWRSVIIMLLAALVGSAWAYYNYTSTGGRRGEAQLQPLVWTMFATPAALFVGWAVARWREVWLAAFACFCLYFFTFFIAARIESFVVTPEQASANGHDIYFKAAMVVHLVGAAGLAIWRGLQPPPATRPTAAETNRSAPDDT